jgi:alpha-galactosidase
LANPTSSSPATNPQDMVLSRTWTEAFLDAPATIPISFIYNGKKIKGIPATWKPTVTTRRVDANLIEHVFEGVSSRTGLKIRCEMLEYQDYPVVEWTVWFSNIGKKPTPILSDIEALEASFAGKAPVLYHCNGDFCHESGYAPEETPLSAGTELTYAPNGGRPCDGAFPYYRVKFKDCGITLAIGWPGQWEATFAGTKKGVSIKTGQQLFHARLNPGECIRTPRITLLSWTGDTARAINLWRRWYLAHVLPRPNGQPLQPLVATAATETGEEFTAATEENQLRFQDRFAQENIPNDVWWIDAGWYPCMGADGKRHWWATGNWVPDPERFPKGFKPTSEHAAERGTRLLVWFEPERVARGSKLFEERQEWLLQGEWENDNLLNLGIPECRQWLTDHVCDLIQRDGIGIYRQDFNFPPLTYWRNNDAEDRQGMNENLHIQGYLQFWDDLLARNPGLWIDSCSSGGRRNDLETMRRSVPLHYTDFGYGNQPVKLGFQHTMYAWIPYFKDFTLAWDLVGKEEEHRFDKSVDRFSWHCGFAPMLFPTLDIRRDDYDFATAREMIVIWQQAAPMLLFGDYYPLTPFSTSIEKWVVRQFDRPEENDGFVQAFRHKECAEESITVKLQALDPQAEYLLKNPETGEEITRLGAKLAKEGFTFSLPARSAAIWFYRKRV